MALEKYQKNCPVCGITFLGRLNKIYCSENCKANFNNKKKLAVVENRGLSGHTATQLKNDTVDNVYSFDSIKATQKMKKVVEKEVGKHFNKKSKKK